MPASVIGFENSSFLHLLWAGSLLLISMSLLIMVMLIVRRVIEQYREKRMIKIRQDISRCFMAAMVSPVALTKTSLPAIKPAHYPFIMQRTLDTLRNLRGEDTSRIIAVITLWNMPDYLYKVAGSGRRGRRIQALTLLGYFSDAESLHALLHYANDEDMYVQIAALRSLALRGATGYIDQIVEILAHSAHTNTLMLHDILQRFGEPAVPALIALATASAAKREVRQAALMALGSIGSLQAVDTLITLTNDADEEIRAHAIASLGNIGDIKAAEAIVHHMDETSVAVRVKAAQALGKLQSDATLPHLAASLSDDEWWVRFRAAEALYCYGDKGIAILQAYSTQSNDAGIIANQILAEHGKG